MKNAADLFLNVFRNSINVLSSLFRAALSGHLLVALKFLGRGFRDFNDNTLGNLPHFIDEDLNLESETLQNFARRIRGLHSLLPDAKNFRYSVLIPVYRPNPEFFRKALVAALEQSAPNVEILIGYDGQQPEDVLRVTEGLKETYKETVIKTFQFDRDKTGGGISRTTNALAAQASGNYLLLLDHDDWIRPDLLFRYEQTLQLQKNPASTVLFCDEYKINEKDEKILSSFKRKPKTPIFPYLFVNSICHCLLVPKTLWEKTGGLRPECDGAQDYDLSLRLDLAGAEFQIVPFFLYAWRAHSQSTAQKSGNKDYATQAGIRALKDYIQKRGLAWEISAGLIPTSYRAIPSVTSPQSIHAVVLFRDRAEMTLKSIQCLQKQKGVSLKITALDHQSQDRSIGNRLREMGAEVIDYNGPFNYSAMNNLALRQSRLGAGTDLILFQNNDVELQENAVQEMTRWIHQPKVGMVGCRLNFPDGRLQHGGIDINESGPSDQMNWIHAESHLEYDHLGDARIIRTCDAVTAASMLIKREVFERVGGFDEIFYPVAYSDTDLARKVRSLGLVALYTPYASGTHYESATRGPGIYEDFEGSSWLFHKVENTRQKID